MTKKYNNSNIKGYVSATNNLAIRYNNAQYIQMHVSHIERPVFMTLNFKQHNFKQRRLSTKIDDAQAAKDVRYWYNNINRKYFGNHANTSKYKGDKLKLLEYLSVREISRQNALHYHIIIEQPEKESFESFKKSCETTWDKVDNSYPIRYIEKMDNINAAIYLSKNCDKYEKKGKLDDYNCHFKPENILKLDENRLNQKFMNKFHSDSLFNAHSH